MDFLEICSNLFENLMGLLISCFLNPSNQQGGAGEDRDETSRASSSSTPPPAKESSSTIPLSHPLPPPSLGKSSSSTLPLAPPPPVFEENSSTTPLAPPSLPSRKSSSTTPPHSREGSSSISPPFEANSSSALPSLSEQQYEVFLSFRGETRREFTDYLYTRLINAKVSVFRDKEGLPLGERNWPEVVKAIESSRISILVISPEYASSEWCLDELIQILKCKEMFGQCVIPIFYRVTPSDLRKESYLRSQLCKMRRHDFDGARIQEWKAALVDVSYMTGLESEKIADRYEGELVEIVVTKVLKALKALRKPTLYVGDDLVGVDYHVEKIRRSINVEGLNDVHAILIHGMGGIGKTTLAKVIYNQLTDLFYCCSFLANNIRETWSQHKGKEDLQDQLILDILGKKESISSVDRGVEIIRDRFKNKKVLILLDDVDHRDQLNALAGKSDWFGRGSILIVTSRMNDILKEWEGNFSYELNGLKEDQSFILFCKHAFKKTHCIPNEFHTIAKKIVSTTGGLPLAIEVIGCLLYGEDQHIWKEKLKKLKEIPDDQVQNKLKISFDALNHEEQQIFLDIACLPIHEEWERKFALHMWDSCRFYPALGIRKLMSMSLIKIGGREEIIIHDQLRDLGREIVRKESINNPGKRSRLWKDEEAQEVLELKQGTEAVATLSNGYGWPSRLTDYTSEQFEGMTKLRYLQIKCVALKGDFKNLFQNLRWLKWRIGLLDFMKSNFIPKKLVVLELDEVNITERWMGWSQMKGLKVLIFSNCNYLTATPDLSALKELEVLMLHGCSNLVEIHPSIGKLKLLVGIDLRWTRVTQLPDSVGDLCNLESLVLVSTPIRSLPTSIRMLSKLQLLDLSACHQLESLLSLPCSLTSLKFYGNLMETLPDFSNLTNLELRWHDFRRLLTVRTSRKLMRYSTINRRHHPIVKWSTINTKSLLDLPSNLVELSLYDCCTLQTLPNFSNWKNLSLLHIRRCPRLMKIDSLDWAEKLKDLAINECRNLVEINGLDKAGSIQKVSIGWCLFLERIGDLSHLKMLTTLELRHCDKLSKIQGLENLTSLKVLNIYGCTALQDLPNQPKDVIISYTPDEYEESTYPKKI